MDPLMMDIDITTDGEYEQHGEVKIVMTTEQINELGRVLYDIDPTAMEEDAPKRAAFVQMLINAIREARPAS